jgi:hypothetical protein
MEHMKGLLLDMIGTGTCAFADFREGGVVGVAALNKALEGLELHSLILGRPTEPQLPLEVVLAEVRRILLHSNGLGMSGANDLDMELLQEIAACTRDRKSSLQSMQGKRQK